MSETPTKIQLHKKTAVLELHFGDSVFLLPAEFLRVHSPSAEVQGHGPDQAVLQHGKKHVTINKLEVAGNYGLRIYFDDGHDTGIFTWAYLHQLGDNQSSMTEQYEQALHKARLSREPNAQVIHIVPPLKPN